MKLNFGKIAGFIVNHADDAVHTVESLKYLFTKGSDKKAAAMTLLTTSIHLSDLADEDKLLALIPEVREALDAVLETRVAALKAKKELEDVIRSVKALRSAADPNF